MLWQGQERDEGYGGSSARDVGGVGYGGAGRDLDARLWPGQGLWVEPCLSQHGVGQLADLLHVVSTDVQFATANPEQRAVRQFPPVELHLDEVVFPCIWVLDPDLQNQLWERGQKFFKIGGILQDSRISSYTVETFGIHLFICLYKGNQRTLNVTFDNDKF